MILFENVSKSYPRYSRSFKKAFELLSGKTKNPPFHALKNVSFAINPGEVVGLVGRNGAGKSTLLKLIAGTIAPSKGQVRVDGKVAALLELGHGFHPDMTGRENLFLQGVIQGLGKHEIIKRFADIVAFAELEAFIDQPVKTYSSGMLMRLAFAVATAIDPEILIIDEALSVGDGAFARKSFERIMAFKQKGATILFCSHSLYQVEALCERALWVDAGTIAQDGPAFDVIAAYNEFLEQAAQPNAPDLFADKELLAGMARIIGVQMAIDGKTEAPLIAQSQTSELVITVSYAFDPKLPPPVIGMTLTDSTGKVLASASSKESQLDLSDTREISIVFPRIALLRGKYGVGVYLLSEDGIHIYDAAPLAKRFEVRQEAQALGIVHLPHRWQIPYPAFAAFSPQETWENVR